MKKVTIKSCIDEANLFLKTAKMMSKVHNVADAQYYRLMSIQLSHAYVWIDLAELRIKELEFWDKECERL